MRADARSKFAKMLDTVQSKEFWQKAKALVELSAPAMNLLRLADNDIPATGKVYRKIFKIGLSPCWPQMSILSFPDRCIMIFMLSGCRGVRIFTLSCMVQAIVLILNITYTTISHAQRHCNTYL
jgi:hypothetical protein